MSILEILESKRTWYENNGQTEKASATQAQIMAMRQAWVKAMHGALAKEQA